MLKNKGSLLLLAAGVLYAIHLYGTSSAAKNLKVLFNNIKFEKTNGLNFPTIVVNFRIINPSSTALKIESIVGDLFINGKLFSAITQTIPMTIPANNVSMYSIKVETGLLQAITSILQILREQKKLTVTFKGVANSTGFMIPISQTIIQM